MSQQEILALLAAALASIDGDFERRNRISRFENDPLGSVLSELSRMEREVTSAQSVRLIAMAKQALTGKAPVDPFVALCRTVTGTT